MLELKNICINLIRDGRILVDDFHFTLNRGDKAVIIGEEGNGKSTLLQYVYNPDLINGYCESSGSIVTKAKCAYLPQMMPACELDKTVAQFFASVDVHRHADILARFSVVLSDREMRTLSGGEKVKAQLAKIFMEEPDILLLDEPMNGLDNRGVAEMRKLLLELKEKGTTIVLASHSQEDISILCDTVWELDHGEVISERG